jgi:tRNA(Met) C34 N-acetyltransferase TmcA
MSYEIILGRDKADKKALGKRGLITLGKGYVKMGQYTSLSNKILMDIARSHVVLVAGKRGSGKSYSLGVLTEEISNLPKGVRENVASLIFDTMGIYWTMKFENEKEKELLKEWDLKSKELPVKVFVPFGFYKKYSSQGVSVDESFALDVKEMSAEDWILTFNLNITHTTPDLIENIKTELKEQEKNYDIDKINTEIEKKKK